MSDGTGETGGGGEKKEARKELWSDEEEDKVGAREW